MADTATPAGNATAVLPVTPAVGRIAQQAPLVGASIPQPSALLALGAPAPAALTYDARGLLRAMQSTPGLTSPVGAGTAASVDAAALTGVNADAARSGLLNSPANLQPVPANAAGAVEGLMTGQSQAAQAASLDAFQVNALNASSTGLDVPSSAAAVVNASGALHSLSPDRVTAALASLEGADLGKAAAGLNVNSGQPSFMDTTGLLFAPGSDSTSQALSGLLTTSLSLANAGFSANLAGAPGVAVGANQALVDVLASDVSLSTAAMQASAVSSATVGTATVTVAGIAAPVVAPVPEAAAPETPVATPAAVPAAVPITTAPGATPATPASAGTPLAAATAGATATGFGAGGVTLTPVAPAVAASAVNRNFLLDAAAQAANNIASNPNYAAMVATLYVHAAVASAQLPDYGSAPANTDVANLPPPVGGTLGIRAARRI